MLPGLPLIRECPSCSRRFLEPTLASGNTFGATQWTDGWLDAPMLPDQPWLVKCPHCTHFIWLDDDSGDEADDVDRFDIPRFDDLDAEDYHAVLEVGAAETKEKVLYVRRRAWWAANDVLRGTEADSGPVWSERDQKNMEALLNLLSDSDDEQRLAKGEIFRELGRFDEAEKVLETDFSSRLEPAVQRIATLVGERKTRVDIL